MGKRLSFPEVKQSRLREKENLRKKERMGDREA